MLLYSFNLKKIIVFVLSHLAKTLQTHYKRKKRPGFSDRICTNGNKGKKQNPSSQSKIKGNF